MQRNVIPLYLANCVGRASRLCV